MHFGSFFLAEYLNIIVACAMTTTLYLGGWSLPGFHPHGVVGVLLSLLVFAAKTAFLVSVFIWVRWTLPRFRYDQLMRLGWKVFLPVALVNLLLGGRARALEGRAVAMERLIFDAAAVVTILFAALMVVNRNPVKSVLALVVSFFFLAVCFVLLSAPFIAAIQVIVYAGAILVLFLFVLMLLNVQQETARARAAAHPAGRRRRRDPALHRRPRLARLGAGRGPRRPRPGPRTSPRGRSRRWRG